MMVNQQDAWKNDRDFREHLIEEVRAEGKGNFAVKSDGSWLSLQGLDWVPEVGDRARYFGRGIWFSVRGVVVFPKRGGTALVAYYLTPDQERERQEKVSAEHHKRIAVQEAEAKAAGRDEAAMRAEKAPWPKTLDELTAYIKALSDGPHTYGTCVYAMSLSATAAYQFIASHLGCTGFQASCADLDILRRTRGLDGPFMILKAEDLLYPQYDLQEKLNEFIDQSKPWVAGEARKRLADQANNRAHPDVKARWEELASVASAR